MRASNLVHYLLTGAVVLTVAGPVAAADPAGAGAPAKVGQCFVCHGADGLSKLPDAPNLAGQNEAYLVKALNDYRSGKREHEVMSMMAKNMSNDDIASVAAYFSRIVINVKAP